MAKSNGSTVPEFMRQVVGDEPPASERAVAEQAVLALNSSMFTVYDHSLAKFKQNLRDRVPIILALFTGQGGQFILYRPGQAKWRARADRLPTRQVDQPEHGIYEIVSPPIQCEGKPAQRSSRCIARKIRRRQTISSWTCPMTISPPRHSPT